MTREHLDYINTLFACSASCLFLPLSVLLRDLFSFLVVLAPSYLGRSLGHRGQFGVAVRGRFGPRFGPHLGPPKGRFERPIFNIAAFPVLLFVVDHRV